MQNRMALRFAIVIGIAFIVMAAVAADAAQQRKAQEKVIFSLEQCIEHAVEVSPEIAESRHEEEVYKAKKLQADSAVYPQIEVIVTTGISPEARIEEFYMTDVKDHSFDGVFGRVDYTLIQPIYTFGKIDGYRKAAEGGVKVAQAGVKKKKSEIVLRTKELYFSLVLAKDIRNLILEIKDELVESRKKAEKQIKEGSPWADELNLFKLNAFLAEAERNLNEADKGIALAKDALVTSMGLPKDTPFDVADTRLDPEAMTAEAMERYLALARTLRPEFIQIDEGLKAREALVEVEKSNYYPHLFAAVRGYFAGATNRDRLNNPYVMDMFNDNIGAAFLGLKWNWDFGITKGRVQEAEAEYLKLTEKKKFADEAIPLQVRKAFYEFEEARKNIKETREGYLNAKKWLVAAVANFDVGVGEAKDIGDAAALYAKLKAENLKALYNHRVAYANLLYASGAEMGGQK